MTDDKKATANNQENKALKNGVNSAETHHSPIRKISPLGMRVLVKIIPQSNVSEGGLYLPEGAKDNMAESLLCEVIEVASAVDDETEEETNISGIPQGAHVLIPRKAGTRIPWDHNLRIVESREILAIVDQIDLV